MQPATIVVIVILLAYGLAEFLRSDLFSKKEQCRNDGITEAISTFMLLIVTQPLIIASVSLLGQRYFPEYQGTLGGLSVWAAILLFLLLDDMMQYWWHRASHSFAWLYNLHRAGPASRQTGRMVVVEGYMDVIALAAAGIEDAVAPLGTALTENQIELLWRGLTSVRQAKQPSNPIGVGAWGRRI